MSHTNATKKLTLNRETIQRLDNSELEGVVGGWTPTAAAFTASIRVCRYTPRAVATAVGATNWVNKHAPKGGGGDPSVVGATA